MVIHIGYDLWMEEVALYLSPKRRERCRFFRIHLPVQSETKHQAHLSPLLSLKSFTTKIGSFSFFFFFTSIVWSNSRPKAYHAVILQQFYHFLPADSAETVDSQERSKRICHHLSLPRLKGLLLQVSNYCLCQCQWSGEDAIKVAGEHTSHCCLCSCGTDTAMLFDEDDNDDDVSQCTAQCKRLV